MQTLLTVEEDTIKNKNRDISDLQAQLHELNIQAQSKESQKRIRMQEVNEFIFQLDKFAQA